MMLSRRLGGIEGRAIASALARIAIATAVMGAATVGVYGLLAAQVPSVRLIPQIIRMAVTIAVALGVLAGAAHVLRVPQFAEGVALITRRLRRRG